MHIELMTNYSVTALRCHVIDFCKFFGISTFVIPLLLKAVHTLPTLLDILCPRFESAFKPGEYVAVDEAMIAFKGRASFRQYIRGRPHPFGIKAFVLADSNTGYVYQLRLYFGGETDLLVDPSLLQTTGTVLTLTQPLEGLGHHVLTVSIHPLSWQWSWNVGVWLSLVQPKSTDGQAIKSAGKNRLQRGSVRAYRAGKTMALQWQDKRTITVISTTESCNIVQVRTHRGQLKEKPKVVQLYNEYMLGVDKMDQLATYYSFLRKSGEKFCFGFWRSQS